MAHAPADAGRLIIGASQRVGDVSRLAMIRSNRLRRVASRDVVHECSGCATTGSGRQQDCSRHDRDAQLAAPPVTLAALPLLRFSAD